MCCILIHINILHNFKLPHCPEGHELKFTILVDIPWSSLLYTKFVWSMHRCRDWRRFLKKYINFTLLPQNYLPLEWGFFLVSLSYRRYISNLVKIGPSWAKEVKARRPRCMWHDEWWGAPTHSNRSSEWLRWLKILSVSFKNVESSDNC